MSVNPERPFPREPEQLNCDLCLSSIPYSVAETPEGPDYVHHFFGIDCMERWRQGDAGGPAAAHPAPETTPGPASM